MTFNVHTATLQEIFDYIVTSMIEQGKPSYDDGCRYRGPDGCKCAAGFIIPDDAYDPDSENQRFQSLVFADTLSVEKVRLIRGLQGAHDLHALLEDDRFIKCFKQQAYRVAQRNQLDGGAAL